MKKIMWVSRHTPTQRQIDDLSRLFPGHEVVVDSNPFSSADDIVRRFNQTNSSEMVVVAPWTVMREIIRRGIRPIYAEMRQVPCDSPEAEVTITTRVSSRCYRFVRFLRCNGVSLDLSPINPPQLPLADGSAVNSNPLTQSQGD